MDTTMIADFTGSTAIAKFFAAAALHYIATIF
jgi:hypothetical protein